MMDQRKRDGQADDDDERRGRSNPESPARNDDENGSYYYDDATGYEIYNEHDDEDSEEPSPSD